MARASTNTAEPTTNDAHARRLVALMVSFSNTSVPLSSESIRAAHYPELSPATFLRQFSRDRQRLAEAGLVIVRERVGRSEATWHADASSFANADAIAAEDALMIDILCSQLASDPSFAPRSELRHALAKIDASYGEVTAASIDAAEAALPALEGALAAHEQRRVAQIGYVDAQGRRSERTYAVLGSFGLRGHTYLVCARAEADGTTRLDMLRTLRDDRLVRVRPLAGGYEVPEDFSTLDYRRLPFQIGPSIGTATLLPGPDADDLALAELMRLGRPSDAHDHAYVTDMSDLDDAATWAIAEGFVPTDPPELVRAYAERLRGSFRGPILRPLDASHARMRSDPPQLGERGPSHQRKDSETQTRELMALVGALREQGSTLSAPAVAARLGIDRARAEELLSLVLTSSSTSAAQLPLGLSEDESELVLCFSRGSRGRPLRLTVGESRALAEALDVLGFAADDPLRADLVAAFWPDALTEDEARRRIEPVLAGEANERLEACSRALTEEACLSFSYRGSADAQGQLRTVLPLSLRHEGERWYLDAHDLGRQALRSFRIDRMEDVRVTGGKRRLPQIPADADGTRTVLLRFHDAHLVKLLEWPHLKVLHDGSRKGEDEVVASIPYYGGPWLARRLASGGGTVTTDDGALAAAAREVAGRLLAGLDVQR